MVKTSPGLGARTVDRLFDRLRRMPAPRNEYVVERGLRTPTRDGFVLISDHYAPADANSDSGTILIRTPYGRGVPVGITWGRTFAARGYHVIVQSVRGTVDSTGAFQPFAQEGDDAQDTVEWLREQPWFNGALATVGMSYLAYTQWALLADPPPEMRASVMIAGPQDFSLAMWEGGVFGLECFLGWSDTNSVPFAERPNLLRQLTGNRERAKRLKVAFDELPMARAAESALHGRAPWYREWLEHPDLADPYWRPYNHTEALQRLRTPVLLVGGWQDIFLGQTIRGYQALRERDADVAMTIGPWTHVGHVLKGSGIIDNEALDWLDMHLGKKGSGRRPHPVRTFVTGSDTWHASDTWPPKHTEMTWYPDANGLLATTAPTVGQSTFRYDPSDPTPSAGGRRLANDAGVVDNQELEARPDVLSFTTPALTSDVEFEGFPVVEAAVSVDNPHADLFIRICDVDPKGRSRNITDTLVRLDPTVPVGDTHHITATLLPCAHRLKAGHRLRLQLSGGAHPHYARNLGTDEPVATATTVKPSTHTIHHSDTRITLPTT